MIFLDIMKIINSVKKFAKIFHDHRYEIYLVGGAVRDYFLGYKNFDYDFATNAKPEEVIKLFKTVIPVGIEHGTVLVLFEDHEFEVTTFRKDSDYSDNRHPDSVNFISNINEDLERRDFTINSMAYDLISKKIIDIFDAKKDLKKK